MGSCVQLSVLELSREHLGVDVGATLVISVVPIW